MKALSVVMAALLAVCMIPLAACSGEQAEGFELSAEATNITYDASGQYTTTLTPRSGVSMKDMTASDISVYHLVTGDVAPAEETGEAATEGTAETEAPADDAQVPADPAATETVSDSIAEALAFTTGASQSADDADATADATSDSDESSGVTDELPMTSVMAEVQDFQVADDGTATLTFTDPQASYYLPDCYFIASEAADFVSQVLVDYPTYTLTPDIDYVPVGSEATKITLVLDDGEFASDISADDITLYGSFEGLSIESLSSAGKNLTLQLVGPLKMTEEAGIYLDGSVAVAPRAIPHASAVTRADIPVHNDGANFVQSELKVENGTTSVPLNLYGAGDLAAVTPESITFSDSSIKATSVEPVDDTQLSVTLEVPDVATANEAAARLNNQEVTVADLTFTANFPQASFWPVFDYVGDAGSELEITLNALAANGAFADDLAADDVALSDGFDGATVESVERTADTTAEIKLKVPAGDQAADSINITGTVTLAAGTLVNTWGEPTTEAASVTRDYTPETLGRDVTYVDVDGSVARIATVATQELEKASKLADFVNKVSSSTFVTACSALGNIGSVASGAMGIINLLTFAGVIPDKTEELATVVNEINTKMDGVHDILIEQSALMNKMQKTQYEDRVAGFNAKLDGLRNLNETMQRYFALGKSTLGLPEPDASYQSLDAAADPSNPFAGMSLVDQNKLYNARLIELMSAGDRPGGPFDGFLQTANRQVDFYNDVVNAVTAKADYSNAIYNFDYLCSLIYNFETQARSYRGAFRSEISKEITTALSDIELRYDVANNPQSAQITQAQANYNRATEKLKIDDTSGQDRFDRDYTILYIANIRVERKINLYNRVYNGGQYDPAAKDGIWGWGNLSEAQQNDFLSRMNGRTGIEELAFAQFKFLDILLDSSFPYAENGELDEGSVQVKVIGISLAQHQEFQKGGPGRYNKNLYQADYIPLDKSEIVKNGLLMEVDDPGKDIILSGFKYDVKRHVVVNNGTTYRFHLGPSDEDIAWYRAHPYPMP